MIFVVFFRLSESFDRFEIDTLEEIRQQNGQHPMHGEINSRRRQRLRDPYRRSISRGQNHNTNHNRSFGHSNASSRERSLLHHERSRSHSAQVQSRQNVRKSSVKDRLGTPVKKSVRQRLSPVPSTSQQQHHNDKHSSNGNETQALDQIDGFADPQETFDMSDLDSILNKCICKFSWA